MRNAKIERKTLETEIMLDLNLDGEGKSEIDTGIGFLDHMLTLFAFHGNFDLNISCKGDLNVDEHHTIEDLALTLGQTINKALGDKKGIKRYSSLYIPMDESLCRIALDISNRPYLVYGIDFISEKIGDINNQNFKEFFKSLVNEARITLHIQVLYGENDHHKIEAVFKAFGRALKEATRITSNSIVSTKGVL